jgi:hypothetical protein
LIGRWLIEKGGKRRKGERVKGRKGEREKMGINS